MKILVEEFARISKKLAIALLVMFVVVACNKGDKMPPEPQFQSTGFLGGTKWNFIGLYDYETDTLIPPKQFDYIHLITSMYITFDTNGIVSGNTEVNVFEGTYSVDGDKISFTDLMFLTAMADMGSPVVMYYLSYLGSSGTFEIKGTNPEQLDLFLYSYDNATQQTYYTYRSLRYTRVVE